MVVAGLGFGQGYIYLLVDEVDDNRLNFTAED